MDFTPLFNIFGEPLTLTLGAMVIGVVFGAAAQQSRFCLRSAILEATGHTSERRMPRLALWLLVFGVALAATQWLISSGMLATGGLRQLTAARSVSGVLIGGLLFGVGMILTRGCVSRLTVLSANGNLRAVVTLLVFAAVAYATFGGFLAPLRQQVLGLWTLAPSTNLSLLSSVGISAVGGIVVGGLIALAALAAGWAARLGLASALSGIAIGLSIAGGWWLTYTLSNQVFEPIPVESVSFIRPAIDTVELGASGFAMSELKFGIGILLGVLAGSFVAALLTGRLKFEWFASPAAFLRYSSGAALMGFGGVVAGGCSVGNGVTGGSLLALAPMLALGSMIAGSALTDFILNRIDAGRSARGPGIVPAE